MPQHVLIAARFKHLEQSQWENDVREIALSAMVPTVTPKSIKQALNGSEAQAWEKAIIEEFKSFDTPVGVHGAKCMEVVDVSELPPKACILGSKYEFKINGRSQLVTALPEQEHDCASVAIKN